MKLQDYIFAKYLRIIYNLNLEKSNKVHNVIISAIFKSFLMIEDDIDQMRLEICLKTATGEWLDLWGYYFNIPRKLNEPDPIYSDRIISTIIEPKATIMALKKAAAKWLNLNNGDSWEAEDIRIFEPWTELLVLSHRGELSHRGRLPDMDYWSHCVVDISVPDETELNQELIEYLNTIKAAGVKLVWSRIMGGWEVLDGYYDADSVTMDIEMLFDLVLNMKPSEAFHLYSASHVHENPDSCSQLSNFGILSGRQITHSWVDTLWDLMPARMILKQVHGNPSIQLGEFGVFLNTNLDDLTLKEVLELEYLVDRQIPNLELLPIIYEDKVEELKNSDPVDMSDPSLVSFDLVGPDTEITDSTAQMDDHGLISGRKTTFHWVQLEEFLKEWNTFNYLNQPLQLVDNILSRYQPSVEISTEKYTIDLDFISIRPTVNHLSMIFGDSYISEICDEFDEFTIEQLSRIPFKNEYIYRYYPLAQIAELFGIDTEELTQELMENPTASMVNNWLNYSMIFDNILMPVEISTK